MLAISWDTVRLFLHVVAATIWVGGQLTLATLVPTLRRFEREVTTAAARRYNEVAWPAFGVLVATGIWNIVAVPNQDRAFRVTLTVKLCFVLASGLTAWLHIRSTTARARGVLGSLTGLTALGALFFGIVLAG
jgi:putative copper export protein